MGDKVFLDEDGSRGLAGPYLIASVPSKGNYTLSFENGDKVQNGKEFKEKDLAAT